jgi:hypothetical protein
VGRLVGVAAVDGVVVADGIAVGVAYLVGRLHATSVEIFMTNWVPLGRTPPAVVTPPWSSTTAPS